MIYTEYCYGGKVKAIWKLQLKWTVLVIIQLQSCSRRKSIRETNRLRLESLRDRRGWLWWVNLYNDGSTTAWTQSPGECDDDDGLPQHELNRLETWHGWQWHIGGMFCHSMKSITWRTPRSYHSTNSIAWRIFCHNAIPCHSTNSIAWRVMMVIQVYDRWKL